ncbi:hypothetical protein F5Y10DRAFT_61046 [Nemania abortiva]|nr:hypothetical protein F5Y10DRAFT_61046 [Nemania abortiva]
MSSITPAPSDPQAPTTAGAIIAAGVPTTTVHLTATYTSPRTHIPQTLSSTPLALPTTLASTSTSEALESKTSYLRDLRAATVALQDRINAELTARMEEDAREAQSAEGPQSGSGMAGKVLQGSTAAAGVDEVAEEEHYGEEAGEEDDEV